MSHSFGNTTNFTLDSSDGFWSGLSAARQSNVAANANFLKGQVEAAFTTTTGWFGTDTSKFGTSHRQEVVFDQPDNSGAFNNGYGNPIHVDTQSNNGTIATAGPIVSMLWMAEWAEVLMSLTGTWNAGDSSGEGLSHYCALQLFLDGHNDYYNSGGNQVFVQNWLNGDGTTNPGTAIAEQRALRLGQPHVHRRRCRRHARQRRRRPGELRVRPRLHLLPDGRARLLDQRGDRELLEQPRQLLPRGHR